VLAAATDSTDMPGLIADGSRMGHVAEGKFYPIDEAPVIVKGSDDFISYLKPVKDKPMTFSARSLIYPEKYQDIKLVPFFTLHDERYMIYWQIASPEKLENLKNDLQFKEKELKALEEKTVDAVVMGEQQPEVDHHFKSEQTEAGSTNGKTWRTSKGWFSYDLQNKNREGAVLRITYAGQGYKRKFDLLLNDKLFRTIELENGKSDDTFFVDYEIPTEVLKATTGESFTVKFSAHDNYNTGRIFSIRLLKHK
jgi:hypothetical protein